MSEVPHDGEPVRDPGGEPVGSVADEAAKLFGALSDWARDHGPDVGSDAGPDRGVADGVVDGLAARAAAAARQVSEHVDTGATECDWCPVCRTVHLVRAASPEVRDHLASAAASLMQAAAGVLATMDTTHDRRSPSVEHIDLDPDDGARSGDSPEERA